MPPLEGLKNTHYSRPERYPEEYADLVARTENGEFTAYRAVWVGDASFEDAVLFIPPKVPVSKARKAYENLADENYLVMPITAAQARDRLVVAEQKREQERLDAKRCAEDHARIEAERNIVIDIHGYADFLKAEHKKQLEKPSLMKRMLGRLSTAN